MEMDFDLDLDELEPMHYGEEAADADEGCGNCGKTGVALHHVPEFDYMGCDDCMEEALKVLAAEADGTAGAADRQVLRVLCDIKTACVYPPIPSREYDYAAWIDGREEWHTGYGPTPAAAIADLQEWIELEEDCAA